MNIRPATPEDVPRVQACAEAAYQIYVAAIGRKPAPMVADFGAAQKASDLHVACLDQEVAGFVVFFERRNHMHLENVAVSPAHQGKGIGGKLIDLVERETVKRGLTAVELYTNVKMTGNLTLYPALGYEEIGRWSEDGFDRVFYRKTLKQ
ncbi:MAG: GNAT family N-acetyltransferase [Rhizobiales bacterium]|nr:GNAT family N-acetyltransferase [Hyphomicrobiales bacterium]